MSESAYSLSALEAEIVELRKDYTAFCSAYDTIRERVQESSEVQPPRYPLLHTWSGSRAVVGSLEMSIHSIERTIAEMNALIQRVRSGEVENTDMPRPVLTLVRETDTP